MQAPVATKWKGVLDATTEPPGCVEAYANATTTNFDIWGQEDCLYLNIFSPRVCTAFLFLHKPRKYLIVDICFQYSRKWYRADIFFYSSFESRVI